jgi:hypothetical protein
MEKLSLSEMDGKRRQITFRIGPIAQDRLEHAAGLFNMKPTEYAKAVLYKDLGVFNEPLDQRRRAWKQKKKGELENDDKLFAEDLEGPPDEESKPHGRHTTRTHK